MIGSIVDCLNCKNANFIYFYIYNRSVSIKSRSGSDLNKIDDTELFSELDRKSSDVMKELNSLLRSHSKKKNNSDRDIA